MDAGFWRCPSMPRGEGRAGETAPIEEGLDRSNSSLPALRCFAGVFTKSGKEIHHFVETP